MAAPDHGALEELLCNHGNEAADSAPAGVSVQQPIRCGGCGGQVCDRFFLLAAGKMWHGGCLRCGECRRELQTQPTLFCRDGKIYCQQDYSRIFGGGQCARCFQPIAASDLVMKSGEMNFHPHCFSCQECDVTLLPGNLYSVHGQHIYCQSHYHGDGSIPPSQNLQGLSEVEGEEPVSSPELRLDDGVPEGRGFRRTKRIRTCFRSEQLEQLESYFAQKQNPDGKDWNFLSHKTGLPKRVLQVWFQNARAKLRRSLGGGDEEARAVTAATASPSPSPSPATDQSEAFPGSTIDQWQLSLLTAPLSMESHAYFLDYDSQDAPGCVPSLGGERDCSHY